MLNNIHAYIESFGTAKSCHQGWCAEYVFNSGMGKNIPISIMWDAVWCIAHNSSMLIMKSSGLGLMALSFKCRLQNTHKYDSKEARAFSSGNNIERSGWLLKIEWGQIMPEAKVTLYNTSINWILVYLKDNKVEKRINYAYKNSSSSHLYDYEWGELLRTELKLVLHTDTWPSHFGENAVLSIAWIWWKHLWVCMNEHVCAPLRLPGLHAGA